MGQLGREDTSRSRENSNAGECVVDPRIPCPGTVLTRRYKGKTLQIHIRERGFEFDGRVYASLSAVARAITGSHCNGLFFFRLTRS